MKFTTDFTTIDTKTWADISTEILTSLNAEPIIICKNSNHPEDSYLYLYIAKDTNGTYITGLANTSRNGYVGLYENYYDITFKRALEIIADKIHDCNK